MAARGWGKEAEFIPQSHTFFLTYTPVVRWQAPSLSNATRRKGLKEKHAGASSAVRQYLKTEVFFFISQIRFQLPVTMVTRIHVVDTLEQTQSLPPLRPPRSLSLCGLPACQAGSRCSQLLQKKQPVIVTGNADMEKLRSPPPPLQFHHCFNYSLRQTFYFIHAHKNSRKP